MISYSHRLALSSPLELLESSTIHVLVGAVANVVGVADTSGTGADTSMPVPETSVIIIAVTIVNDACLLQFTIVNVYYLFHSTLSFCYT